MRFNIVEDSDMVSICCKGKDSTVDGFIDIYIEDGDSFSIFASKKEARMFAEIIVRLLGSIT